MNDKDLLAIAAKFPLSPATIRRNKAAVSGGQVRGVSQVSIVPVNSLRQQDSPSKPKVLAASGMSEMERRLNKTEKRFLAELRSRTAHFSRVGIQEITLRLAWDTRYTADFNCVTHQDRIQFFEVKGFMRDDARVKLYTAAAMFPCFIFWLVKWEKGQWVEKLVKA